MSKQPELPEPAHAQVDSMLSRKFGREVANYFSGSPLNRLGFLRGDHTFLSSALQHPSTKFLAFKDLHPLVADKTRLAHLTYSDVKPLIGDPYASDEKALVEQYNSSAKTPQVIFLGVQEKVKDMLSYKTYKGLPYFAVDVTPTQGEMTTEHKRLEASIQEKGQSYASGKPMDLNAADAAIYAEARHILDWNSRNPFCAQCGQPTLSINGGFKRMCPPTDMARLPAGTTVTTTDKADKASRPACATRKGVSNLCFPRTDPTVIMAVVNAAGTEMLLGRSKRFPPSFYSALAGFCEPAESVEEAVRREVWEEAGVHVGRVVIHSTQPWPYPANLMIGAVAQTIDGMETIDIGHDPELEDAKWVPLDRVRECLKHAQGLLYDDNFGGDLKVPGHTAIAHQLLLAVVDGYLDDKHKL